MRTNFDAFGGQSVGSHIRMSGRILGLKLSLGEIVREREPPTRKVWETVGVPRPLRGPSVGSAAYSAATRRTSGRTIKEGFEMHDHHEHEHPHGPDTSPKKPEQAEPTAKPEKPAKAAPSGAPAQPDHAAHEHKPGDP